MKVMRRLLGVLALIGLAAFSDGVIAQPQTLHHQATYIMPGPAAASSVTWG